MSLVFASLLCNEIDGIVLRERWVVKGLLPRSRAWPGNDAAPAFPGLGVPLFPVRLWPCTL